MTKEEAKALFRTAETAFEVSDIMAKCFIAFGRDETDRLIEEIRREGVDYPPYFQKQKTE